MWKDFQKALEKRVKRTFAPGQGVDDYLVIETAKKIIQTQFGQQGRENVEVLKGKKNGEIVFRCQKSIWRNELKFKKEAISKEIAEKLKIKGVNIFVS